MLPSAYIGLYATRFVCCCLCFLALSSSTGAWGVRSLGWRKEADKQGLNDKERGKHARGVLFSLLSCHHFSSGAPTLLSIRRRISLRFSKSMISARAVVLPSAPAKAVEVQYIPCVLKKGLTT